MSIETKVPLQIVIANAKREIKEVVEKVKIECHLPACVIETVLSSVMIEVKGEVEAELIDMTNMVMQEKNKELEKAKAAAKKVLTEDDRPNEEGNPNDKVK